MSEANRDIRVRLKAVGAYQWQLAQRIGLSAPTLTVWLRVPLTDTQRERVIAGLEALEAEKGLIQA